MPTENMRHKETRMPCKANDNATRRWVRIQYTSDEVIWSMRWRVGTRELSNGYTAPITQDRKSIAMFLRCVRREMRQKISLG